MHKNECVRREKNEKISSSSFSCCHGTVFGRCGSSTKKIESKEDLKDAVIGVQLGTTGDTTVSEASIGAKEVKRYNKGAQAIQALKKGQIDCVVIDTEPAKKFVELNDDLKMIENQFEDEQ